MPESRREAREAEVKEANVTAVRVLAVEPRWPR
jgi:hypothetical protein